jgi:hypothetical protein
MTANSVVPLATPGSGWAWVPAIVAAVALLTIAFLVRSDRVRLAVLAVPTVLVLTFLVLYYGYFLLFPGD